jgi:hypothetical protein
VLHIRPGLRYDDAAGDQGSHARGKPQSSRHRVISPGWSARAGAPDQIHDFLERRQATRPLEAVRGNRDVATAIVDALIALEPRVKALRRRGQPLPANVGDESHDD